MTHNEESALTRRPGIVDVRKTEIFSPPLKISGKCRRALLIALSYSKTDVNIKGVAGCVSTVTKALEAVGFSRSDIEVLSDNSSGVTGDSIMSSIRRLIEGNEFGDIFFLMICGHWIPHEDPHGLRPNRICFHLIPSFEKESTLVTDRDVYTNTVQNLVSGTRLTILLEGCTDTGSLNFPFSGSLEGSSIVCENPWFSECDARLFTSSCESKSYNSPEEDCPEFAVGAFTEAFAKSLRGETALDTFLGTYVTDSRARCHFSRTPKFYSTQKIEGACEISLTDILCNTNPILGQVVERIYSESTESSTGQLDLHVDRGFKPGRSPMNKLFVMLLKSMLQTPGVMGNHSLLSPNSWSHHAPNHNYVHHAPHNTSIFPNYTGTLIGQHPMQYSTQAPHNTCYAGSQSNAGVTGYHSIDPNFHVTAIPAKAVVVSTSSTCQVAQPQTVGGLVSQSVTSSRGKERALLIGCNYMGQSSQLSGCINDCINMRELLISTFHFDPSNIRILTDDNFRDPPTYHNIILALQWLVSGASGGDCLFFHFSGHGGQMPDNYGVEEDGFNETILPCDHRERGEISDNQLFQIMIQGLPAGVRLTAVMDCCNSGTGLDLPLTWWPHPGPRFGWKEDINPWFTPADVQLFSGCQDGKTAADLRERYRPACGAMTTSFCNVLKTGYKFTYVQLLNALQGEMLRMNLKQRPQLSSSQPFGLDRQFSLRDAVPNRNKVLGRIIRKRFTPGNPQRVDHTSDGFQSILSNLGNLFR